MSTYKNYRLQFSGINATCDKSEDCVINNGDCVSKICRCKENYVPLTEDNCVEGKCLKLL